MLSGWAVAIGLGLRLREITAAPEPPLATPSPPLTTPPGAPEPAPSPVPGNKFASAFESFAAHPEFAGAALGFCVFDENGATLFASPLAGIALSPASSLKTVTTGAALSILGPEFRFETVLAATSPVSAEGKLDGDLVLVGSGDPTLETDDLDALAKAAAAAGLKSVSGRLLVDASVFPENPVSDHWVWGDLGNAYGAGAYGLNLDHNRVVLRFEPSAQVGGQAKLLDHTPVPKDTRWTNLVTTGPAGSGDQVVIYSEPYGRAIVIRGTVPAGQSGFAVYGSIPDPPALAAELLRARLEATGVKFANAPSPAAGGKGERTVLARHTSDALPEIIDHLHLVSDNLEAQCLFLTIGRKLNADPASALREHYHKAGVTFAGLRLLDGSGLARANAIRPLDLARVNFATRHGAHGQRFYESLSKYVGGEARAKIGSMSGVKTQVGFLHTAQGREFTYAVMGNALPAGSDFWSLLESLLETVRTIEL